MKSIFSQNMTSTKNYDLNHNQPKDFTTLKITTTRISETQDLNHKWFAHGLLSAQQHKTYL